MLSVKPHLPVFFKFSNTRNDFKYNAVFRQVANGEILGMSLLLEDILQTGDYNFNLGDDKHKSGNAEGVESSTSVAAPETSVVVAAPAS